MAPSPITTPEPTVATPFSPSFGMAPTTAFFPMVTFSATIQCFTTAPAWITVAAHDHSILHFRSGFHLNAGKKDGVLYMAVHRGSRR